MTPTKLKSNRLIVIVMAIALLLAVYYVFFYRPTISAPTPFYRVVGVIDGDTIKVERFARVETVRLLGIDTPEVPNPYKPEGCFGDEARQKTKELLDGRNVYLIPDSLSSDRDKYGRLLRYVFLPNGEFINANLISEGYAFNYIYEPFQFMKYFDYLEKQAREKRAGVWSNQCDYYFELAVTGI